MPASTEKVYYKMREPKEIFKPLLLVKDPKSGFMKQQLPKKEGGRRTKRKTKRRTKRKTKHRNRA
jgi:hypothetical protein